jgi:hypothetical protein
MQEPNADEFKVMTVQDRHLIYSDEAWSEVSWVPIIIFLYHEVNRHVFSGTEFVTWVGATFKQACIAGLASGISCSPAPLERTSLPLKWMSLLLLDQSRITTLAYTLVRYCQF